MESVVCPRKHSDVGVLRFELTPIFSISTAIRHKRWFYCFKMAKGEQFVSVVFLDSRLKDAAESLSIYHRRQTLQFRNFTSPPQGQKPVSPTPPFPTHLTYPVKTSYQDARAQAPVSAVERIASLIPEPLVFDSDSYTSTPDSIH